MEPAAASGVFAFASLLDRLNIWALPLDANTAKIRGELVRLSDSASAEISPRASDDGKRVAYVKARSGRVEIRLRDVESGKDTFIGEGKPDGLGPAIAPDGSSIVYPAEEGKLDVARSVPSGGGVPQRICTECRATWAFSPDGKQMLFWPSTSGPATVGLLDLGSGQKHLILQRAGYAIYRPRVSRDGRWVAFHARNRPGRSAVFVAPFHGATPISEQEWIAVSDGESYDLGPAWSPNGNLLYYLSERDGFRCVWAQRLKADTRQAAGAPFAILHFHAATRSMIHLTTNWLALSVATDKLVFNVMDVTGNVWLARSGSSKH
jgi:Tol biopolymer transport system component